MAEVPRVPCKLSKHRTYPRNIAKIWGVKLWYKLQPKSYLKLCWCIQGTDTKSGAKLSQTKMILEQLLTEGEIWFVGWTWQGWLSVKEKLKIIQRILMDSKASQHNSDFLGWNQSSLICKESRNFYQSSKEKVINRCQPPNDTDFGIIIWRFSSSNTTILHKVKVNTKLEGKNSQQRSITYKKMNKWKY